MRNLPEHIKHLVAHRTELETVTMRDLFASDPDRFDAFSLRLDTLLFDFSKNRVTSKTIDLLAGLAQAAAVEARRDEMFSGGTINETEERAVLHTALRSFSDTGPVVDGRDVMPDIDAERHRMDTFSGRIRSGDLKGATGKPFRDVVNIGVGGSDLGPAFATAALRPYHDGPRLHFLSNMDGSHVRDTLEELDPAETLFLVASKSFTTDETMTNAATARSWLAEALGEDAVGSHFVALSTNLEAVSGFGIPEDRRFGFWDWVGGRYSLWSVIGLPICLAIGYHRFQDFLAGAESVDTHFRTAPIRENIPFMMALIGIWYRNIWSFASHAVIPYDQRLARFPAYLQQLDMESNGKRVDRTGSLLSHATGPVVWGEPGTNSQHAVFQLLHQGTDIIPVDFLLALQGHEALPEHHDKLAANCFAQAEALMVGRSEAEVRRDLQASGLAEHDVAHLVPHKVMPGNRPSNMIVYDRLDPKTLGMLIALYEHKVFVQGVIWGINSFDQWGVELGKKLAREILPMLRGEASCDSRDASTRGLIRAFSEKNR